MDVTGSSKATLCAQVGTLVHHNKTNGGQVQFLIQFVCIKSNRFKLVYGTDKKKLTKPLNTLSTRNLTNSWLCSELQTEQEGCKIVMSKLKKNLPRTHVSLFN